jgi:DNA-binding Lrp family transcriptional regulator
MSQLLELLLNGENLSTAQMAQLLNLSETEIRAEIDRLIAEGVLLGYRPILHPDAEGEGRVRAVIEVKITPEREGGFDRLALRISRFDEVESCYLMSGGYDLLVFVSGRTLREVATFVSERLSTLGGVISTATHFLLRPYKEKGFLLVQSDAPADRPAVSP